MKYKVIFDKWAYVEADSEDEAMDKAGDGDIVYEEEELNEAFEVDEFFVRFKEEHEVDMRLRSMLILPRRASDGTIS